MSESISEILARNPHFNSFSIESDPVRNVNKYTCRYHMQNPDGSKSTTLKSVTVTVPVEKEITPEVSAEIVQKILSHIEKENNLIPFPKSENKTIDASVILAQLAQQQKVNAFIASKLTQLEQKYDFLQASLYTLRSALEFNNLLTSEQFDQAWDLVVTKKQLEQMKSVAAEHNALDEQVEQEGGDSSGDDTENNENDLSQSTNLLSHMLRRIHLRQPTEAPLDSA